MKSSAPLKPRLYFAAIIVVLICQAVVVSPSYFIFGDDWFMISYGRDSSGLTSLFERQTTGTPAIRPVPLLLARFEHAIAGDSPLPRLLWHLGLHGLAALLLSLMLTGIGMTKRVAQLTSLLFLVMPLSAEPLAWYHSGHTTIPLAVTTLAALAAHANQRPKWLVALLCLLALLTRENAVMLFPVAAWISWRRSPGIRSVIKELWPAALVGALFVGTRAIQIMASLSGDTTAFIPVGGNPLKATGFVLFHLLAPVHPGITAALPLAIACGGLILIAVYLARKEMTLVAIWLALWCLPFLPFYVTEDPLFSADSSAYERRWYHLYMPSMAMAWLLVKAFGQRTQLIGFAGIFLLMIQLMNCSWWAGLGPGAKESKHAIEKLLSQQKPLLFEFEGTHTALSEIVEHQTVDLPRMFPNAVDVPIFRKKPGEQSYIRASQDAFGYPTWVQVPRADLIPENTIRVIWDFETNQLKQVTP